MEDEHADPDGNEDEDPDDELAQYASQPAPIDSMSPTIGRSTQETDGGVPATQAEPGLEYDAFALSGSETPGERDYDSDNYQQYTFTKLLNYRWVPDDNAIELEVQWHNDESTWEPETNLHRDAPDALFRFWAAQGGRPDNPREPGLFDIFAIRGHSRNRQSLLVEWTGYPPSENCWVSRKVLHETAPEVVDDYMRNISRK